MFREEKRLVSMLLCIALLLTMLPVSVFAQEAPVTFRVEASAQEVTVGDTIDFTVSVSSVNSPAMEFRLVIPGGLHFISGSGVSLARGELGSGWTGGMDWTESSMIWTAYNDFAMTFPEDTVLLSFSCIAEAEGTYQIDLSDIVVFDGVYRELDTTVTSDVITVADPTEEPTIPDRPSSKDEPDEPTIPDRPSSKDEPDEPSAETTTVYCKAPTTWYGCKIYWWGSSAENPSWPGVDMTMDANGIWCFDVPSDAIGLIFTNGTGTQSGDLTVPVDNNVMYTFSTASWVPYGYIAVENGYYVAGSMNNWCASDAAYKMTEQDDGTYTLPLFLDAGSYELKVTDGTWTNSWGDGNNNYKLDVDLLGNYVIHFDGTAIWVESLVFDPDPQERNALIRVDAAHPVASVGDTVDFTVSISAVTSPALEFVVAVPEGLRYVSGSVPADTKGIMGWAAADWTERSMIWTGYNDQATDIPADTVLLRFSCIAEAKGAYQIDLSGLVVYDGYYNEYEAIIVSDAITVVEACTHNYISKITVAATCATAGECTFTCSKCGNSYSEEIPTLNHTEQTIAGTAATCTETGLTDGVKCSVCGEILTAQEGIPALGHTEEVIPGYSADCNNPGLTDGVKCSVCGETLTAQKEIPALGHSYEAVITPPTITEGGYTTHTCANCGDNYIDSYTQPLGVTLSGSFQTFLDGDITLELVKDGKTEYTVTVSGKTGSYELTGVVPGSYILKVSKDLHVTREYELTVDVGTAPVDVKLHRPGDINGDGRLTVADVSKAYAHTKKTTLLTGYEFLVSDVNGDSRVTVADVSKLYAHTKKTTILW